MSQYISIDDFDNNTANIDSPRSVHAMKLLLIKPNELIR